MSTNVGDRQSNLSLLVNTPQVIDQKETFKDIVDYFESTHQKKEVPIVYCEKCLDTGWQKVVINNVPVVVRCKENHHLIDKLINAN